MHLYAISTRWGSDSESEHSDAATSRAISNSREKPMVERLSRMPPSMSFGQLSSLLASRRSADTPKHAVLTLCERVSMINGGMPPLLPTIAT